MKLIGHHGICILLLMIFLAGCIDLGNQPRAPREGDLSFTLSMEKTVYKISAQNGTVHNVTPESIPYRLELRNDCSDVLRLEKYLTFSATLGENITDQDGNRISLAYDIMDYGPTYSNMDPGENMSVKGDLVYYGSAIKIGDDYTDFDWDVVGTYFINFFYGTHKENGGSFGVKSNTVTLYLTD
ncbi:MAG: hypothetical protein ACMUHY_04450 [Thermoplasmatota archaeon]